MATKHRYVPILRWKEGEQGALKNLGAASKAGVTPLIVLLRGQYASTKPPPKQAPKKPRPPAGPAADLFCMSVADAWGNSEMYLDASDLPSHDDKHHLLDDVASAARDAGLRIIPATTLDAPELYQAAVRRMASKDGRGAALRVTLGEMGSAPAWLDSWPFGETDLIIDLGREASTIAAVRVAIAPMFVELYGAGSWRSVTVAGSCMPQNFSGLAVGTHRFARSELSVWHTLVAHDLPYRIDFGDYATVAVGAAPPGVRWGFPINAKYTLKDNVLVCHGVRTTGEGAVGMGPQLVGHAKAIVAVRDRAPLPHCWGDAQIDQIAAGKTKPGGLTEWVMYSVNRHIELTRANLP